MSELGSSVSRVGAFASLAAMKNLTIKKVGVLSAAKLSGVLGVVIGLLVGLMYALVFLVVGASRMGSGGEGAGFLAGGAFVVCVAPIVYGGISFVMGALYAFVFNVVTDMMGGLELTVEETNVTDALG